MKIYQTRPTDERSPVETAVYILLEQLNIPFERVDHEVKNTIEECGDVSEALGVEICKNLFLCNRQKTDFYLVMLPGKKKFETKKLSKLLGVSRLSFAPEEFLPQFLGLYPGSVSILGLMNDVQQRVRLVMDCEVAKSSFIGCHPCQNTSSLKIATKDVLEKFLPFVQHFPAILEL